MTIALDATGNPFDLAREFSLAAREQLAEKWLDSEIKRTGGRITIEEIVDIGLACDVRFHPVLVPLEGK